jgi:uncharacterized protein
MEEDMTKLPRRLRELDKLLSEFSLDSDAMTLSDFDGFVAGLLVCPDMIPPSVWLPIVVGETEGGWASFQHEPHARKLIDLLIQHYNATATALLDGIYEPIFFVDERHDETLWEIWIEGFEKAVALNPTSWAKVTEADEPTRLALANVMTLALVADSGPPVSDEDLDLVDEALNLSDEELDLLEEDEDSDVTDAASNLPDAELDSPDEEPGLSDDELGLTEEERDRLFIAAPDLIPQYVLTLSARTHARDVGGKVPDFETFRAEKVGRNEPCPCGSGKKYKKCCALKEAEALAAFRGGTRLEGPPPHQYGR